ASAASDVALGDLSFGNPFPCNWQLWAVVGSSFNVEVKAPGATSSAQIFGEVASWDTPRRFKAEPTLTPLVGVQVAGRDAFGNLAGVGIAPTIRWNAPAVGEPTVG